MIAMQVSPPLFLESNKQATSSTGEADTSGVKRSIRRPEINDSKEENRISTLEQQIKEKDQQIESLKEKKAFEQAKTNSLKTEMRKLQNKTRPLMAKMALENANIKREQRRERNDKLGYFSQNMRTFYEGTSIQLIKKKIKEKEEYIKRIQATKNKHNHEDHVRALGAIQFTQKVLLMIYRK